MKISIIVPAWNEESRIQICLDSLLEYVLREENMGSEIIISADGCTDRTTDIVNNYSLKYPQIKLAYWPDRLGKGGGILNGLRIASGDVVVIFDPDLSSPVSEIPKLVALVDSGRADLVLGSRNLRKSVITDKPPMSRKLSGKSFNFLFRLLLHENLHDTQCGFKIIKTSVFRSFSDDLQIDGYAFDIDLIINALWKGFKVIEIPIIWGYRKGSKIDVIHQSFEMARSVMILWLECQRKKHGAFADELTIKTFYDTLSGDTYYRAGKSWFLPRQLWHKTKNRLIVENVKKNVRILDIGCGSGITLERLLPKREIYGIDLGKNFIKFCQDKYKDYENVGFVLADARWIPFCTEVFDHIICSEVIEHIQDVTKALNEFSRILKPCGKLILTTPNMSVRWSLLEALWTRIRRKMIEIGHKAFTKRRIYYLLSSTEFHILNCRTILFGCLLFILAEKRQAKEC